MQRSKPCVDIQLHTFSVAKYVIQRQIPSLQQIQTNYPIRESYKAPHFIANHYLLFQKYGYYVCKNVVYLQAQKSGGPYSLKVL